MSNLRVRGEENTAYQFYNNNPLNYKITCFPSCNIVKIDQGIVHIESMYFTEKSICQQFKIGINQHAKITYTKNLPEIKKFQDIWAQFTVCYYPKISIEDKKYIYPLKKTHHSNTNINRKFYCLKTIIKSLIKKKDNIFTDLLKHMSTEPKGYECKWTFNKDKYKLICLDDKYYIIMINNDVVSAIYADNCDLRPGDENTTIYLMEKKHIMIWNNGTYNSIVLFENVYTN